MDIAGRVLPLPVLIRIFTYSSLQPCVRSARSLRLVGFEYELRLSVEIVYCNYGGAGGLGFPAAKHTH